jgi:hypothetical protein
MNNLKRLVGALVLTIMLGATTLAGDIMTPSPPPNPGDMETPTAPAVPGDMHTPSDAGMVSSVTELTMDLLESMLTLF